MCASKATIADAALHDCLWLKEKEVDTNFP